MTASCRGINDSPSRIAWSASTEGNVRIDSTARRRLYGNRRAPWIRADSDCAASCRDGHVRLPDRFVALPQGDDGRGQRGERQHGERRRRNPPQADRFAVLQHVFAVQVVLGNAAHSRGEAGDRVREPGIL